MSVLSDKDLAKELGYGDLDVSPVDLDEQLQPNSLDIRLGKEFTMFRGGQLTIDSKQGIEDNAVETYTIDDDGVVLAPGSFVLANTKEYFDIPDYLYAELNGRSSLARLGIEIHCVGGVLDSGFSGELTLEISNNNPNGVRIYPDQRIGQIIFYELSSPCNEPYGKEDSKYQEQEGAVHSRLEQDFNGT